MTIKIEIKVGDIIGNRAVVDVMSDGEFVRAKCVDCGAMLFASREYWLGLRSRMHRCKSCLPDSRSHEAKQNLRAAHQKRRDETPLPSGLVFGRFRVVERAMVNERSRYRLVCVHCHKEIAKYSLTKNLNPRCHCPDNRPQHRLHWIQYQGEVLTMTELAKRHGLSYSVLSDRLRLGWALERAVSTPYGAPPGPKPGTVRCHKRSRFSFGHGRNGRDIFARNAEKT